MENHIRLFVAVTLPAALHTYLSQQVHQYQHSSIRFVPEQNLHLTLYFIGNVPQEQLPAISQAIKEVAMQHQPFTLVLEQLEPGPKLRSPRLVWARFRQSQPYEQLSQELTRVLAPEPPKEQKAIPHVTVARFRKDKPAPKNLPVIVPDQEMQLPVDSISLWRSELKSPHPVYSILETFPLQHNP
ncbi:RNA 2',3'-cyclic phosphodiesterase [Pontibacter ruber]|uniref:RNA 2',3'-cyclic phosphodiesterase n=1 Tax=Pontibacter ruber TaxID=1343895 RepID=A0ABW5CUX4_9BACT|nr:RNA 2',3'-cyclic phosphodiesterase [Pontibacter ruber]